MESNGSVVPPKVVREDEKGSFPNYVYFVRIYSFVNTNTKGEFSNLPNNLRLPF